MSIVTLTTDFGVKDHYVGALKGALLAEFIDFKIIDITHHVSPFNIHQAAYLLENAYTKFPKGSIHIIGVDSERTPENKHVALYYDDHYFIGADNGILSFIAKGKIDNMVEIHLPLDGKETTCATTIFVKVAAHIARGGRLEVVGKPLDTLKDIKNLLPLVSEDESQIQGHVIYIDHYGNVVTNIHTNWFSNIQKGRSFTLSARSYKFKKIHNSYSDAINFSVPKDKRDEDGKKLALFNSEGYVELAIYKSNLETVGGASTLLGLQYRDTITINFD